MAKKMKEIYNLRGRDIDWLRAGRPGDRMTLGRDFPHLSSQFMGPNQSPVNWVLGFFQR